MNIRSPRPLSRLALLTSDSLLTHSYRPLCEEPGSLRSNGYTSGDFRMGFAAPPVEGCHTPEKERPRSRRRAIVCSGCHGSDGDQTAEPFVDCQESLR
jgi:hypothetical protein